MSIAQGVMQQEELQSLINQREAQTREGQMRSFLEQIKMQQELQKQQREQAFWGMMNGGMGAQAPATAQPAIQQQTPPSMGEVFSSNPLQGEIDKVDQQIAQQQRLGRIASSFQMMEPFKDAQKNIETLTARRTSLLGEGRKQLNEEQKDVGSSLYAISNSLSQGNADGAQTIWNTIPAKWKGAIKVPMDGANPDWTNPLTATRVKAFSMGLGGLHTQQMEAQMAATEAQREVTNELRIDAARRDDANKAALRAMSRERLDLAEDARKDRTLNTARNSARDLFESSVKDLKTAIGEGKLAQESTAAIRAEQLGQKLLDFQQGKGPKPTPEDWRELVSNFEMTRKGHRQFAGETKYTDTQIAKLSSSIANAEEWIKTIGSGNNTIPTSSDNYRTAVGMMEVIKDHYKAANARASKEAIKVIDNHLERSDSLFSGLEKTSPIDRSLLEGTYGTKHLPTHGADIGAYLGGLKFGTEYFKSADGTYWLIPKHQGLTRKKAVGGVNDYYRIPVSMTGEL